MPMTPWNGISYTATWPSTIWVHEDHWRAPNGGLEHLHPLVRLPGVSSVSIEIVRAGSDGGGAGDGGGDGSSGDGGGGGVSGGVSGGERMCVVFLLERRG